MTFVKPLLIAALLMIAVPAYAKSTPHSAGAAATQPATPSPSELGYEEGYYDSWRNPGKQAPDDSSEEYAEGWFDSMEDAQNSTEEIYRLKAQQYAPPLK